MATLGLLVKTELKKSSISAISLKRSNFHTLKKYQKCYKLLGIYKDDKELQRTSQIATVGHREAALEHQDEFSEMAGALKLFINTSKQSKREERENLKNPLLTKKKESTKIRATQAAENVVKHRLSKISKEETKPDENLFLPFAQKKYGFERSVEEMIQDSMSKGEFKNLPGFGKPLPDNELRNPYVDFVTHRLNEVLIDNGCTPKWITLQKEIREDIQDLKEALQKSRANLGPYPLEIDEASKWETALAEAKKMAEEVNKKIRNFNLLVPILEKQMFQVNLDKEAKKILITGECKKPSQVRTVRRQRSDIFDFLDMLFKK